MNEYSTFPPCYAFHDYFRSVVHHCIENVLLLQRFAVFFSLNFLHIIRPLVRPIRWLSTAALCMPRDRPYTTAAFLLACIIWAGTDVNCGRQTGREREREREKGRDRELSGRHGYSLSFHLLRLHVAVVSLSITHELCTRLHSYDRLSMVNA